MPKISELTVADLRGAATQLRGAIDAKAPLGRYDYVDFRLTDTGATFSARVSDRGKSGHVAIYESAEWDTDWTELLDKVWKRVGQIPSREVSEIRSVMEALGSAIEIIDKSKAEFAVDLTARIKQARDDAGARLIEYQKAAQ